MKKILLLLSLLLAPSAALADLGAADTPIPTDQETLEAGAFCAKWRNDCKVKITSKMLIVDEINTVSRENIVDAWNNQIHMGTGIKDVIHVIYIKDDGTRGAAQFLFSNMKSAARFYNRLQQLIKL